MVCAVQQLIALDSDNTDISSFKAPICIYMPDAMPTAPSFNFTACHTRVHLISGE